MKYQEAKQFYDLNPDLCEAHFEEYISFGEWGSGDDKISITDDMFWEFIQDYLLGGKDER